MIKYRIYRGRTWKGRGAYPHEYLGNPWLYRGRSACGTLSSRRDGGVIGSVGSIGIPFISQLGRFMPVSILYPRIFLPTSRSIQHRPDIRAEGIGRSPLSYFRPKVRSQPRSNPRLFPSAKAVRRQSRQQRCVTRSRTRTKAPALCKTASGIMVMVLHVRQSHPAGPTPDVTPQVSSPG